MGDSAHAAEWTLTTADFKTTQVTVDALGPDGLTVTTPAQPQRQIPLSQFLMIEHAAELPPMRPSRFVAILHSNDVAMGQPKGLKGDNLVWENPLLGEMQIPLKAVAAIALAEQMQTPVPAGAQIEDIILMSNGDTVRGIIADIGATGVSIQPPGGATTLVPLEAIRRVRFAVIGPAVSGSRERGFNIRLADRTSVTASAVRLDGSTLAITLPDQSKRDLPISAVQSIEQINGPVTWLSSISPAQTVQRPFLQRSWSPRMDRAVDGEPIRAGERMYSRGIGVHSYTFLSWPIDPSYKAFRTQYAIAGDWPYANVTVRIKLDDKVVHEKADVRSGPVSDPVVIPIQGQKTLTLEVDYGQNYDVQDRLNWIEPAFLNFIPE